jgi:ribosomal protein L3
MEPYSFAVQGSEDGHRSTDCFGAAEPDRFNWVVSLAGHPGGSKER